MRKLIITIAILATAHVSLAATPYFKAGLGISSVADGDVKTQSITDDGVTITTENDTTKVKYDLGVSIEAVLGMAYDNGFKYEVAFSRQENDIKDSSTKLELRTLGLNTIKEFYGNSWVPFINAGVGFVFTEIDAEEIQLNDITLAFILGWGAQYALSETRSLYVKYNYTIINDVKDSLTNGTGSEASNFELELGLHQFIIGITQTF